MLTATAPPRRFAQEPPRFVRPHVPWFEDVHAEADRLVPGFERDYIAAVMAARARVPEDVWIVMAAAGKVSERHIDDVIGVFKEQFQPVVERDMSAALAAAGKVTLQALAGAQPLQFRSDIPLIGAFNLEDPLAIRFVRTQGAAMVAGITEEVRGAIRALLGASFEGQWDVRATARMLPQLIGLTPRQAARVSNFLGGLLTETGADPVRAAKLADDMAARMLKQRAEAIARTETIRGVNAGVQQGFIQGQQQGLLPANVRKEWIATEDKRTCPRCRALDGEKVEVAKEFSSGDSAPPAHTLCRCAIGLAEGAIG